MDGSIGDAKMAHSLINLENSISVETVAAYNVGKPFHAKENNWLGYLVEMDGVRYFVAGDTDPNEDNNNVKCDVALVPIGGGYTMDKKPAADYLEIVDKEIKVEL